jgi:hypothetical protein
MVEHTSSIDEYFRPFRASVNSQSAERLQLVALVRSNCERLVSTAENYPLRAALGDGGNPVLMS